MTQRISRRALGLAAASAALAAPFVRARAADAPFRLRCSLDTAPSHGRNVSVADFLKKVEDASDGRIKTELFSSGQLFADLDVSKALIQGQVEMACPGHWTQTGFVPDADLFQLPVMYGQRLDVVHRATDGSAGRKLAQEIEAKLRSHVLGPWIDLGYQNWYSTSKPLNSLADFQGLKVRSPGGAGIAWRIKFAGGIPNTTAWPNVPLALSQGTFDALISTDESLVTAQLWEAGIKYSFADHNFVGEYIPMVSLTFWNKLPDDLKKLMTDTWAANIGAYRAAMADRQAKARETLMAHGVKFGDPSPEEIKATRAKMMPQQDEVAREIKVSPEMVKLVMDDVGANA
jgi:C4-dicarboxylate-binding protein DctP